MKRHLLLLSLAVAVVATAATKAQVQRPSNTQTLYGDAATSVLKVATAQVDVVIDPKATRTTLTITGPVTYTEHIKYSLADGIVKIRFKGSYEPQPGDSDDISLTLRTASLDDVDVSAAGSVSITGPWKCDNPELELEGAATLEAMSLQAKFIDLEAQGASTVKIRDIKADILKAEIHGASRATLRGKLSQKGIYEVTGTSVLDITDLSSPLETTDVNGLGKIKSRTGTRVGHDGARRSINLKNGTTVTCTCNSSCDDE